MKKIIIFILVLILLLAVTVGLKLLIPKMNRTYKIDKYNISMKVPYGYKASYDVNENTLGILYNEQKGITINAFDLKDDFWNSGDAMARTDEYMNVMSAANYDTGFSIISNEVMEGQESKFAKVEIELDKPNSISKIVSVISGEEVGNVVIEIFGLKENMDNNKEEIEKIVQSIRSKWYFVKGLQL